MDGDANGTETQGEEQQGVSVEQTVDDQQPQQQPQAEVTVAGNDGDNGGGNGDDGNGVDGEAEYRAALADRDAKIKELEVQIAEASKTVESANALAKQIEDLKASADAERVGFELKLAGCRSVRAGRVLLADHDGDMEALKAAEPWLFEDATVGGGSTGLEPAGAASGGDDELKRWYRIAGIEVEE